MKKSELMADVVEYIQRGIEDGDGHFYLCCEIERLSPSPKLAFEIKQDICTALNPDSNEEYRFGTLFSYLAKYWPEAAILEADPNLRLEWARCLMIQYQQKGE